MLKIFKKNYSLLKLQKHNKNITKTFSTSFMQNEYNNSRHFKVSYKDTRNRSSYFKLYPDFTIVLEDRDNGQRATYLNSSI